MSWRDKLLVAMLVLGILAIPALVLYAGHENTASRVASCKQTYRAFPEMFAPFFPSDPRKWTPMQRRNWDKLQHRADELAARCHTQVNGGKR